jgi:hypothetical protein
MNRISSSITLTTLLAFIFFCCGAYAENKKGDPISGVTCGSCVSDSEISYKQTCCENRLDANGNLYQYCVVLACLPGGSNPDKLKIQDDPTGFTRPPNYTIPEMRPVIVVGNPPKTDPSVAKPGAAKVK